jgi:N-acetyl-anhydromuramyl-L-alanine amidase AmpD
MENGPNSAGSEPRKEKVTHLILHYTAGTLPSSLDILQGRDRAHKVGIHYVVTDEPKPRVIRMVPENMSAFHAGKSGWAELNALNQRSIGIEIINLDGNVHPYSQAQTEIIFGLCSDIIRRHGIKAINVLGHSDIAVGRKVDPGALFPWARLASLGIGAWPLPEEVKANIAKRKIPSGAEVRKLLETYGYHLEPGDAGLKLGLEAFQRHFRPSLINGVADLETVSILQALVRRYRPEELRRARLGKP